MAEFGTVAVYQEMADLLNSDLQWEEKGKNLNYTMVFHYGEPLNRAFLVRFEPGKVTEVRETAAPHDEHADFLISGPPDIWRGVLEKKISPIVALTSGQMKVEGKMTALIKNMNAINYIVEAMTKIDLS